jgi:hypothetical protein
MTQTTTIARIAAADLRHGDVIVNEAGERQYAAFDLTRRAEYVAVYTAVRDQDAGQPRRIDLKPDTVVLIELETVCESHGVTGQCPEDTPAPLSTRPVDVCRAISSSVHVIDAAAVAPGIVRVTVAPGQANLAAFDLIRAGYVAAVSGEDASRVTVGLDLD